MFWYEKYDDKRTIYVELNSQEIGSWHMGDKPLIGKVERYMLAHGLRRHRDHYVVRGCGDLVLGQGTISSLKQRHPDVTEETVE